MNKKGGTKKKKTGDVAERRGTRVRGVDLNDLHPGGGRAGTGGQDRI